MSREQKFACVSEQGTAMSETVLTAEEYADSKHRADAERAALAASDCTRIEWHDVTENDAFYTHSEGGDVPDEWAHQYQSTTCPQCKADLTKDESVVVEGADNEGKPCGMSRTSLTGSGWLLADPAGLLAAGFHAGTQCAACGEYLDDLETIE